MEQRDAGGSAGYGTVFKLTHSSSGWILTPLYSFAGGNDGAYPEGRVTLAPDGTLYGTTLWGGGSGCDRLGCGTVFHLRPSPTAPITALAPWTEIVLRRFTGGIDGAYPEGDLSLDQSGNIYGTATAGGPGNPLCSGCGVVYKLPSGGGSAEVVLYAFQGGNDGGGPSGGVVFDSAGNLYGVADWRGIYNWGTVYRLSPSGSRWTEQTLYSFTSGSDGADPVGLMIDSSGDLYGTTIYAGTGGGGTVFELTSSNGGWIFNTLYGFSCAPTGCLQGPMAKPVMDAAGSLYGTTREDGAYGYGSVFKLTPSNGAWKYTSLHDFTGGEDGGLPVSNLVLDASGNLFGTAAYGGTGLCPGGCGVVFEITP